MGFTSFTSTQPKTIMVTDRAVEKVMNTRFRRNGSKISVNAPIEMGIKPKVPRHIPITPPI